MRVSPGDAGAAEAYAYVARRPHGVIALAEARHLSEDEARDVVERLASDLEACARRLEAEGSLVEGAARIVAVAGPRGTVEGLNVRLAPGGAVAQNALLCLIAPVRSMTLPKGAGGGAPAFAIEATWGPASISYEEKSDAGETDAEPRSRDM